MSELEAENQIGQMDPEKNAVHQTGHHVPSLNSDEDLLGKI